MDNKTQRAGLVLPFDRYSCLKTWLIFKRPQNESNVSMGNIGKVKEKAERLATNHSPKIEEESSEKRQA